MDALIITIGDEILSGATVDTNAAYIAKKLISIGVDVTKRCSVGDDPDDIEREIRDGLDKFDVVVTTGGLGPTDDDMTKPVACRVFNTHLVEHRETLEALKKLYKQLGLTMSDAARGMAMQPKDAILLSNPLGTAPGILFDRDGKVFCSIAGVPSEMRAIVDHGLVPYLRKKGTGRVILFKNISTFGIPESILAAKLKKSGYTPKNVRLAFLPSYAGVLIRLRAEGADASEVERNLDQNFKEIYEVVGENVFSIDNRNLVDHVTDLLREKKVTVSTAESCTGGLIAKTLTDVPGSSEYFVQGVITYSNDAKIKCLDVQAETLEEFGAVSEQTCRQMAEGMCQLAETDYAISSTGIAGPSGGTEEKPVGLVYIGLADKDGVVVERCSFSGDRDVIRTKTTYTALNMLRIKLLEK